MIGCRIRPAAAAALVCAAAAAGCGFGPGPSSEGTATLTVTRDYGSRTLVDEAGDGPALIRDGDPLPRSRSGHHDALRRRLRPVDRRPRRRRACRAALRLVLLRQRDRVAGRRRRGSRPRRRPDLVGLPRLDQRDAGAGGGRIVARALRPGRVRGRPPARDGGLPDRRRRLRHHGPPPEGRRGGRRRSSPETQGARRKRRDPGSWSARGARCGDDPAVDELRGGPAATGVFATLQGPERGWLPPDRPRLQRDAGQGPRRGCRLGGGVAKRRWPADLARHRVDRARGAASRRALSMPRRFASAMPWPRQRRRRRVALPLDRGEGG